MHCKNHRVMAALSATIGLTIATSSPAALANVLPPLSAAAKRAVTIAKRAGVAGELVVTDANGNVADVAFGLADREAHRPHRAGERWLWASVTKQVTATLVMQEVAKGHLELDAPVTDYLPKFGGTSGSLLTLRQLLQHQSGLPNPADTPADSDDVNSFYRETGPGIGNMSRALGFCAGATKAMPAKTFKYNNCDYLVLGAILEQVTGQQYDKLVATRIARPLGLRTLRLAGDGETNGGAEMVGYRGAARYPAINIATAGAAAALTGGARDLAALDRALMNDTLLPRSARTTLWEGNPDLGYEALGVWSFPATLKGCAAPVDLVERRGDFGGMQARNIIAPEIGRAIILFTNDDSIDFGEVWQGKGLTYDLLSATFCQPPKN
jgi:D-alanyl-D-alanine carboxypeptidase